MYKICKRNDGVLNSYLTRSKDNPYYTEYVPKEKKLPYGNSKFLVFPTLENVKDFLYNNDAYSPFIEIWECEVENSKEISCLSVCEDEDMFWNLIGKNTQLFGNSYYDKVKTFPAPFGTLMCDSVILTRLVGCYTEEDYDKLKD